MIDAKVEAKKIESEIIGFRRDLHRIPEIHDDLPQTTAYIRGLLDEWGVEYRTCSNSGIVVVIRGSQPGKTIGFRADMDALPVKEETGLPFASTNDNMHACGHDAHTAMLLGATKILNENRSELKGNVVCVFQPAEETTGGAKIMVEEGCLDDPKVDRFFSFHIGGLFPTVDTGCFGYKKGPLMAGVSSFFVKIHGVGGHGARPHECVDPVVVMAEMIQSLQKLASREINPTHGVVVTVGMVKAGTIVNVIPTDAEFAGTIRYLSPEDGDHITKRVPELLESIAKANRATADVEVIQYYPPTVNDPEATDFFIEEAKKIVGEKNVVEIPEPSTGTEDVTYYINHTQGCFGILGSWKAHSDGVCYPHHNSKFDIDESVFWMGTAFFVQSALDYLK